MPRSGTTMTAMDGSSCASGGRGRHPTITQPPTTEPLYYLHYDHPSAGSGQAYGGVTTSIIPLTLTDRLYQGRPLDAKVSLVYHGAGRYYPLAGSGQVTRSSASVCSPIPAADSPPARFSIIP